jgi:hypothetical protein
VRKSCARPAAVRTACGRAQPIAVLADGSPVAIASAMANRHELRAYDYVNRPYQAVREALLADPLETFRRATVTASRPAAEVELRAKVGPLSIGQDVAISLGAITDGRTGSGDPVTKVAIEWKSARQAGLFPTMRATLSIYPLSSRETQLELDGTYDPPLGLLGDALDAIALHKVAETSVAGFVRDVAGFLRAPA